MQILGIDTSGKNASVAVWNDGELRAQYFVQTRMTHSQVILPLCEKMLADIGIGVTGSMGNIDPANGDSVPGEIYFAIDFKGDIKQHHIKIMPQESRFDYKLAVADEVVKELLILISLNN